MQYAVVDSIDRINRNPYVQVLSINDKVYLDENLLKNNYDYCSKH